jgi:hypothetical protein
LLGEANVMETGASLINGRLRYTGWNPRNFCP